MNERKWVIDYCPAVIKGKNSKGGEYVSAPECYTIKNADDSYVAEVWVRDNEPDYAKDNANLIVAAPDLLAACKLICVNIVANGTWIDGCFHYQDKSASELEKPLQLIEQAIAKAEGK
jgi:hypothetical protein